MDRATALKTLNLSPNATETDILKAFSRLTRRYPLHQFPERHTLILEAKTALLNPALAFRDLLLDEQLDLSWIESYTHQVDEAASQQASDQTRLQQTPPPLQQALSQITRSHLKKGLKLFPSLNLLENHFDDLHNQLDPADIQRMMQLFD